MLNLGYTLDQPKKVQTNIDQRATATGHQVHTQHQQHTQLC